ncbi:MAG: rod shape-determining protein RodA [Gammaproteobacteria bacterium]|jgi:hypothetical protein|nr:rod shape-determining protein RodA [Gammaproteobacteria bacterium]|tara:strand:- start:3047 stop:3445 length:399 start_codon:yes stop_codon:yes gene_type:complete
MFKFLYLLIFVLCSSLASSSEIELYFIEPKDGATVNGPVKIVFGLSGMGVAPAGIDFPNTGHHHLLVDIENLPDLTKPIPANKNHIHFGKGQTEVLIDLPKGKRSLQLLLGNYLHVPHKKPVISDKIYIHVE